MSYVQQAEDIYWPVMYDDNVIHVLNYSHDCNKYKLTHTPAK